MLPDDITSKRHPNADAPYPRQCPKCRQMTVMLQRIDYKDEVRYDDHLVSFLAHDIEIPICQNCGEKVFTEIVDDQLNVALRLHLHLLAPAEIKEGINRLGLSRQDIAVRLGISNDQLWRWINGYEIQTRAMDNYLRVFFQFPEVREMLTAPAVAAVEPVAAVPSATT